MEDRQEPPPVAAVFLVIFDQKVGYTLTWNRCLSGVDLAGVEYKSLPSGLHAVKEDLIYFIHGAYAGISLFLQEEADARHRGASFVAVGALVPRSYGQLGKSWAHANALRRVARDVVKNIEDKRPLELFWKEHRADGVAGKRKSVSPSAATDGPDGSRKRNRAGSEATLAGFNAAGIWPQDHPALAVPTLLQTFGPLLFPIQRAALSRQRLLFLGNPSVQANANIVYVVSLLATISKSLGESLPTEAEPIFRSEALFSVGIQDIPALAARSNDKRGWIATTTDDILREKRDLYDLLIELPPASAPNRVWPKLRTSDGQVVRASQRDLRRWNLLRREFRKLRRQTVSKYTDDESSAMESDQRPLLERRNTSSDEFHDAQLPNCDDINAVEPASWSAMAYRGFMWWASAGEASAWENDEAQADEELLFDMPDVGALFPGPLSEPTQQDQESEYSRAAATLLVAYFRRVTEGVLRPLTSIVEEADDETEQGIEEDVIPVTADDLRVMGLDAWSESDKRFVQSMMETWFNRRAEVADGGVRICGVKIY